MSSNASRTGSVSIFEMLARDRCWWQPHTPGQLRELIVLRPTCPTAHASGRRFIFEIVCLEDLEVRGGTRTKVQFGGLCVGMSEPQGDHSDVAGWHVGWQLPWKDATHTGSLAWQRPTETTRRPPSKPETTHEIVRQTLFASEARLVPDHQAGVLRMRLLHQSRNCLDQDSSHSWRS